MYRRCLCPFKGKSHIGAVLLREKHCPYERNQLTFSMVVEKKKQKFIAKSQKTLLVLMTYRKFRMVSSIDCLK